MMLRCEQLCKSYRREQVLRDVTLELRPGEILGAVLNQRASDGQIVVSVGKKQGEHQQDSPFSARRLKAGLYAKRRFWSEERRLACIFTS